MIPFTISDSDFRVLPAITENLQKQVAHGIYGYTRWNHDDFKNAVIHWYNTMHKTIIDKEWIVYGPSVMYMIKRMLTCWSKAGDGIISFAPMYDGFVKLVDGLDRKLLPIAVDPYTYAIDWETFEDTCKDENTKVLILCNPMNPIGKVFDKTELSKIVEICKTADVAIISDDIHMDFVYEEKKYTPILSIAQAQCHESKTVIITSATKTFNTAGLMGAYMLINNHSLRDDYLEYLRNVDCLSSAPIMGIVATMTAYHKGAEWVKEMRTYLMHTFIYIDDFIKKNSLPISFRIPESTYFAWFNMSDFGISRSEIQEKLIQKNIAIMDGVIYSLDDGNNLRMNIAAPKSKIEKAMEAIKEIYLEM